LLNSGLSCYGFKLVADVTSDESHSLEPRVGPSRLGPRSVACRNVPHQIQSLPTRSIYVVVGLLSSHPDIPLVNHLNQNVVQRAGDFPPRIMLPEFTHVGDIADVVTRRFSSAYSVLSRVPLSSWTRSATSRIEQLFCRQPPRLYTRPAAAFQRSGATRSARHESSNGLIGSEAVAFYDKLGADVVGVDNNMRAATTDSGAEGSGRQQSGDLS
jgi:hypothetical protein